MIDTLYQNGASLLGALWPLVWSLLKIVAVLLPLLGCVAYLTLWERKAIGWSQIRPGPNRVGPYGLLTPIADAVKLIFKEIIKPAAANKGLFFLGPVMTIMPALAAWAVVPFGPDAAVANVNAGLLFLMAITSLEVYGVIIAGWASNSKYAFLGALRASAQMVSYEIAMGFALVWHMYILAALGLAATVIASIVHTFNYSRDYHIHADGFVRVTLDGNDAAGGAIDAEIVAGHMIEYSGMSFAMFFLAEYANMILVSALAVVMFLGGWSAPISWHLLGMDTPQFIQNTMAFWNWFWLFAKTFFVVTMFLWVRATFPRFRYDQIMRLGWKIFIPVTLVWLLVVGIWMQTSWNIWN